MKQTTLKSIHMSKQSKVIEVGNASLLTLGLAGFFPEGRYINTKFFKPT